MKAAERSLMHTLGRIPAIEFLGFEPTGPVSPEEAWRAFARYDAGPDVTVDLNSPQCASGEWLWKPLERIDVRGDVLLSVGALGCLPWCRVLFRGGGATVIALWKQTTLSEFVILDPRNERLLAVIEDEYHYEATVRDLGAI